MDRPIRVLVANQPRLMRDLVASALADQQGIEVVGEVSNELDIPARVREKLPDVLVVGLASGGRRPSICDVLLPEYPNLRILAVAFSENRTICYWGSLSIHANEIEPSEEGVLHAVRKIAENVGHS